ncbi:MAG TPA: DNA polymerase, partial [Candidatus Paceibacterota bacterium]
MLDISSGPVPNSDPNDRYSRYRNSEKGQARNGRIYDKRKDAAIERYLTKEFVSWDGEGGNEDDGTHTYFLLANSSGSSLTSREGLGTLPVFEMLLSSRPGVTNIIYGGNYDINCWIKDVSMEALSELYQTGKTRWNGYYIEWRPGKSFTIKQGPRSFTIFDVLPFFQCSFVKACDEYLGPSWPYRDEIVREKARRGNFDWSEIESIGDYNRAELENLISLANELRTRLFKVDIRVSRWDGPGAIAASLYKKYQTKSHLGTPPEGVILAGRHAYAGGRFEIIRKGHSLSPAYQYDIRSAYPSAIRSLPCNNPEHGHWDRRYIADGPIRDIKPFGIYRIEVVNPWTKSTTQPQPLWMRNKDGTVYFCEYSSGWYWSPEAQLMTELGGVNIYEAYEWTQECDCHPFHFVESLYNKRAALKKANDGAHIGLKLGLNSLYGKLAQQIGFDPGPPLRLPPYHSLEWAGYITSHC